MNSSLAKVEALKQPNGSIIYSIACGPNRHCVASWRAKVLLPVGTYKLAGKIRTAGVAAIDDSPGAGAGLRISGGRRTNQLAGDSAWRTLEHEFEVTAGMREVELVAELRATKGAASFDAASLRLTRVEK